MLSWHFGRPFRSFVNPNFLIFIVILKGVRRDAAYPTLAFIVGVTVTGEKRIFVGIWDYVERI